MPESKNWRLIYNPEGDALDVVSYGAAVAEGRIAGKYQLSTTVVPDTVIIQRSKNMGIIAGADVRVDRNAATEADIQVAQAPRQGRNGARAVGTLPLSELMAKGSRNYNAVPVDEHDPAVILYTSGTTGNPKGVALAHKNFHFQCNTVVNSLIPFTHEDRVIGVLPFYHVYGLANSLVVTINNGACLVMIPQYSPQTLLDVIADNKATIMPAIPSMYQHLLTISRSRKTSIPKSLKFCVSGGAPLPLATLREFMDTFDTQIIEGYGLTETTSSVSCNGAGGVFKEGSIGPPAEGVEMTIWGEEDKELDVGEVGEIVIRSATVTPGYWNNDEATGAAINADGWFYTGDLGYRDEDGFFFITDRKKDLIIRGGFNISPREVEEVIMLHPKVAEAAVVAANDKRGDEFVKAFVVLKEGEQLTGRDVIDHCAATVAPYKQPKVVEFADSLPKSATGKILRSELRGENADLRLVERGE
ncbi:MAG: acyl-CoA synthetase [Spirochaetales bacterium]|nr:acyl-CoA synthetase [Spirochaetales bacterium]